MSSFEKDKYFVAVKIFLEKDGKFLIMKDSFGDWDLPGGRIKKDEFDVGLEKIIARKMSEELGDGIEYKLGKPLAFMRHQRVEHTPGNPTARIFAIGYQASLDQGRINLSDRHKEMKWVDPHDFDPAKYFTGGWLRGVQDYLILKRG